MEKSTSSMFYSWQDPLSHCFMTNGLVLVGWLLASSHLQLTEDASVPTHPDSMRFFSMSAHTIKSA